MASKGLERARKLAKEAGTSRAKVGKAAEANVVRWEWATKDRFSPEPYFYESHKLTRGRRLKSKPAGTKLEVEEGLDEQGRIVLVRSKSFVTFYRYDADGIARFYYASDDAIPWIHVAWYTVDDGRVAAADFVYRATKSYRSRVFTYDANGVPLGYVETGESDGEATWGARDFDHDAKGRLVRVWWRYEDGRRVVYWQHRSAKR